MSAFDPNQFEVNIGNIPPVSAISIDAIKNKFPVFFEEIRKALIGGATTYGDRSFTLTIDNLLSEVEKELVDISGWSFVLWCRIRELRNQVNKVLKDN